MKTDIIFLRTLAKELRFLKESEKEKFISEYQLKIDERHQKGEEIKTIISSLEPPKSIAREIYDNFGFNVKMIEKKANSEYLFIKWLGGIFSILPQSIIFLISLTLIAVGIIIGLSSIAVFVLCWLNYDPIQAVGPAILAISLLPLLGITITWIGWKLLKMEKFIFKSIWKTLTTQEIKTKQEQVTASKAKKYFFIFMISFCTLLATGGAVGTFVNDKTIGGATISGNLIHTQTETLNIPEQTNEEPNQILIAYQLLERISWYNLLLIEDSSINKSNIEIQRDYNTKESLKLNYKLEKLGNFYVLNADMAWNLLIFNITSNRFTITYNPSSVKFLNLNK